MVTFFLPSSISGSGSLTTNGLGGAITLDLEPDRRHTNTATQPINTAIEVVSTITNSRFSKIIEASSLVESADTLEGSILPLIMADIRSRGEILMELEEDEDEESIVCIFNRYRLWIN